MKTNLVEMKCRKCENLYLRKSLDSYKTICIPCWKKKKKYSLSDVDETLIYLNEKLKKVQETGKKEPRRNDFTMSKDVSRQLLMLCHPDKHNNSKLSQEVTQWILQNR